MSLLEVLLAVAVFAVGIGTVAHLYIGSYYASLHSIEKNQATLLAKEGLEAVRSVKNDNFESLSAGNHIVEISGGNWVIGSGTDVIDEKYEREVVIIEEDSETWKVDVTVSWDSPRGTESSVTLTEYLTSWKEPYLMEYDLSINSSPGGSVTTPGEGTFQYTYEEDATIVADAEEGYVFDNWSGDTSTINNVNSANTFITMSSNYSITANFVSE